MPKEKAPKKIKMDWELRQLLPPAIHDQWDDLSIREEYTRDRVADSYYDSIGYECDREHVDDK